MRILERFNNSVPAFDCNRLVGFFDDGLFLTDCGDVGACISLRGIDGECLDDDRIDGVTGHMERGYRLFGPGFHVYQFMFHDQKGGFWKNELFMVALKVWAGKKTASRTILRKEVERTRSEARQASDSFIRMVSGVVGCRVLAPQEAFEFLRRLVNFDARVSPQLKAEEFLGYQIYDDAIELHGKDNGIGHHIRVGDRFVRVLTLSELGAESRPMIFSGLQEIAGSFYACSEWSPLENGRGIVSRVRDIMNNFKGAGAVSLSAKKETEKALDDEGDVLDVSELGSAQRRIRKGEWVGNYSLTVVVHDAKAEGMERTQSEVERVLGLADCKARPETYHQLGAYLSVIPGNYGYQVRRMKILDKNYAEMSFWYGQTTGDDVNQHLKAPCLMTLATEQRTGFHVNLHVGDVGHTLVLGDTGSGKSFAINAILCSMLELYDPFLLIFDDGNSFRWTTVAHGGSHFRISPDGFGGQFMLNPFACSPTRRNLDFLVLLARVLMEQHAEPLTADELDVLNGRVEDVFLCPSNERRLGLLALLLGKLGMRLKRWCQGGQYGWVFDHADDTLNLGHVQCFEFSGTDSKNSQDVLEPLILSIMHRANEVLYDPARISTLKGFFFGELWKFLKNPAIEAYVEDLLRTGRKNNGFVVMETQSPRELANSRIAEVILGACQTRLYLQTTIDKGKYAELLELSPKRLELIANLRPKGQLLFDQPKVWLAKVLNLEVSERAKWLAANDKESNTRRNLAIEQHGAEPEKWLPALIGS
jgi:type IV secretory pathway VirB4 component